MLKRRSISIFALVVSIAIISSLFYWKFLERKRVKWIVSTPLGPTFRPIVYGANSVLLGTPNHVSLVEQSTGKSIWTFTLPAGSGLDLDAPKLESRNTVFVVAYNNLNRSRLYALDARTGAQLWNRGNVKGNVLGSYERNLFVGGEQLNALNTVTGLQEWSLSPPDYPSTVGQSQPNSGWSVDSVTIDGERLYAAFRRPIANVVAANATTGRIYWTTNIADTQRADFVNLVLNKDRGLIVAGTENCIYAIRCSDGKITCMFKHRGICPSSICIADNGSVIVPLKDGAIYKLKPDYDLVDANRVIWKRSLGSDICTMAVLGPREQLYIGTKANNIVRLDVMTGRETWRFSLGRSISIYAYGQPVTIAVGPDGIVYASSLDNAYALLPPE